MAELANNPAGRLIHMIAMQIPQRPASGSRPVFRVLCAWCERPIQPPVPPERLTGNSHGICIPCARQYFGMELDSPASHERAAE